MNRKRKIYSKLDKLAVMAEGDSNYECISLIAFGNVIKHSNSTYRMIHIVL